MAEPVEVRNRPLFVLPNNNLLLADISNALDMLWENFDQAARSDSRFYNNLYSRTKAKWLEKKISNILGHIFPLNCIYKNLSYPDPDKENGATAELDFAINWGNFLLLVEAKAKQFRMESQLGDLVRLRSDIKANVEDAFQQAKRASKYIDSVNKPKFKEVPTGRILTINKNKIRRVYLLTISQHHLAGLATRLSELERLGLFRDNEYPLSISIADLETIVEFCGGPDVLLHYIEKRLELQKKSMVIIADELELFGAYLKNRLHLESLREQMEEQPHFIHLVGFQTKFDQWWEYKRGERENYPDIKLEVPNEIEKILFELRKRSHDDSARWIAFALLDMSDSSLGALNRMITEIRDAQLTPGMFRRVVHQDGDTVISIVASLDLPPSMLRERTRFRTVLEKYRRKASKSIGIGIMLADNSRPFDCVVWIEGPWEYDEKMERAINSEPPFYFAPGAKLPGRNSPCICGSGRKFKKCCLPKIERWKRDRQHQ